MRSDKVMNSISLVFTVIGSVGILIIFVVTVADVIMNKIFNSPFPGATEIITSAMPISVFGFLLATQIKKRHITIDVIVSRLSGKWQIVLKFLAQGIGIYLFGLLTYLNIPLAIYAYKIGDHTGGNVAVPLYPAKIIIPLATSLITVQLFIELCKGVYTVFSRPGADSAGTGRNSTEP